MHYFLPVTTSTVERSYKVIIVGEATVGKTSFVQRYVNEIFREDYKGTVGGKRLYPALFKYKKVLWEVIKHPPQNQVL